MQQVGARFADHLDQVRDSGRDVETVSRSEIDRFTGAFDPDAAEEDEDHRVDIEQLVRDPGAGGIDQSIDPIAEIAQVRLCLMKVLPE